MRKLIILRGAQGVGKSTFIKERNLEGFTLSSDQIRLMFNSPELTIEYSEMIPQYNNQKVWNILYYLLEERMKKGEFTIIDAVHAKKDDLITYKKLAEKYRYRLYIIDFTDIPKEKVYKQNLNREKYKIVPNESIDKAYSRFANEQLPSSFKILKPQEFDSVLSRSPQNCDNYKNIHIIGDIHGCFTALKTYFEDYPINTDDLYIFTGDYFDRGIENFKTFEFLNGIIDNKNMIFLIGNHEDKLYKYACNDEFKMDYGLKKTIEDFEENNVTKSVIRGFVKKLSQISYITFRDRTYLISHGGIPYFPDSPLDLYSTNSFIYGTDKYEVNIDKIYNDYMSKSNNKVYQIHGHRNYNKINTLEFEYSFNLDGNIEYGGTLRVLNLMGDGKIDVVEIKNDIYNANFVEENNVFNLISELRNNNYIYENKLDNDISSFNFTKEAFYNRKWDSLTTHARGLFIDTSTNRIVARSYDKFFNIDERKETHIDELKDKMLYPVNFYLKYNGFLGILSSVDGELFFASKSTNTGSYVGYFKTIFYKTYDDKQIRAIKDKVINENVTMVFEVIDPINDPHIIKYESENLILLDIIYNRNTFEKMDYAELEKFGTNHNIEIKKLVYTIKDAEEFEKIYSIVNESDYKLDNKYIEGFVIEDSKYFMVKLKSKYYNEWKYLRNKMEYVISNNKYDIKYKNDLEESFITHIRNKYENANIDIKTINIITERDDFLKNINNQ